LSSSGMLPSRFGIIIVRVDDDLPCQRRNRNLAAVLQRYSHDHKVSCLGGLGRNRRASFGPEFGNARREAFGSA
jgi:hypothetical protein